VRCLAETSRLGLAAARAAPAQLPMQRGDAARDFPSPAFGDEGKSGLVPVVVVEALALARASPGTDGHAFLAEQVADAFLIGRNARPGGPEPI
jgi:hypothetical protein